MGIEILSRRCSLVQGSTSTHHMKRGFILLLALTSSLSALAYAYNLSFSRRLHTLTVLNAGNQTQSYNTTEGLPVLKFVWKIMQTMHYHVAHPSNYHFIIDETDRCEKKKPFVVLIVPVAPYQIEARNAIRSTWGNETTVQGEAVLTLFLVGRPDSEKIQQELEEESQLHRDLIQSDFVDSYFNLTIKTMVLMDWLATRCPQATYSMKVDSDMYINLENLLTLLLKTNIPRQNYMTGYLMRSPRVIRNKKSKYYVSEELYPEPRYPIYVLGVAYVFSNDLPKNIVEASKDVKPFNIEDAYIGACLKRLGIQPSQSPDPSQFQTYVKDPKNHNLSKVITTIARSPKQIIEFWESVKQHP